MWIVVPVVALIVYGSLYPFHFAASQANPIQVLLHSWPRQWDSFTWADALNNVLLYFPLGAAVAYAASRRRTALGAGLALSAGLELMQVYEPSRVCSLFDVLCNFAGTAAGAVAAPLFKPHFDALKRRLTVAARKLSTESLLLVLWAAYQLYPFVPHISPGSLTAEIGILLHPGPIPTAEVCVDAAEWFTLAVLVRSLRGEMPAKWWMALIGLRVLLRPFLLTRIFALNELLGAVIAFLLWTAIPERWRLHAGTGMLAAAIALRELSPFRFSHLPGAFGPVGVLLRAAFELGALTWMAVKLFHVLPRARR